MIKLKVRAKPNMKEVIARARKSTIRSLTHAGGATRRVARRLIKKRPTPSPPGSPPHTQTDLIRQSITYNVDEYRTRVIVGPAKHIFDDVGQIHEFGGVYRGRRYPKRPFMTPAFKEIVPRLSKFWRGSLVPSTQHGQYMRMGGG